MMFFGGYGDWGLHIVECLIGGKGVRRWVNEWWLKLSYFVSGEGRREKNQTRLVINT